MTPTIRLHARLQVQGPSVSRILRVAPDLNSDDPQRHAVWLTPAISTDPRVARPWGAVLSADQEADLCWTLAAPDSLRVSVPPQLNYLATGDVVRIDATGQSLNVLYRRNTRFNSLLVTERCNSNCLMCSQPPKENDDSYLLDDLQRAIPLMDTATRELGITGGEPFLLGTGLFELVQLIKTTLPNTALHILTNGRVFATEEKAAKLAMIGHPDLMLGIPLYSDLPWEHDFVVQAKGAFQETVLGLLHLARFGVSIELRMVLHQQTVSRLPDFARFVARNLPFVHHVALMGLEHTGHTPANFGALHLDPLDYQRELSSSVRILEQGGVHASIYNHQLCVLDRELWTNAVCSISDWKNDYLPECQTCAVRDRCGGFFSSGIKHASRGIRAVHPFEADNLHRARTNLLESDASQ